MEGVKTWFSFSRAADGSVVVAVTSHGTKEDARTLPMRSGSAWSLAKQLYLRTLLEVRHARDRRVLRMFSWRGECLAEQHALTLAVL